MTNLASSERLRKQFCQAHKSTIDRPADRRQRRDNKRRLTPVTLTNTIYITRPATSIGASIKAVLLIDLLAAALPRADHTDQQD